ncbi:MAG: 4Fe-4S dicluster domain-containing protein [Planctomycetes bacterium]|nr:4Fe-4S dicluster domain-containing protein [Planctomycetota bacterium]
MQYGFVIDHRKCIGCHACTVACKSENDVPVGSFRTWVKYTEIGTFPAVKRHFAVLRCNHCTNAPCVTICPVNALGKRDDGIVDLDKDACIGCKACMQACPYDALYLNEDTGGAEKCHYCAHRVEQGLKPACEIVCPEEAIVSGDLHDPQSRIAQLAGLAGSVVRRPEQGTGPNVHYLGMDAVSLEPGLAKDPPTYLWSERRLAPPPWPDTDDTHPHATTVLDVNHDVHWGSKVSAYLVTKGIAAGAALLAWLPATLGVRGFGARWLPELLALTFLLATVALLIGDLKRPQYFFRLLTRPNLRSWLVKGGFVLGAFGALTAAILAARFAGLTALADALRIPNVALGALCAGYTAWLFQQCEGRDLWQSAGKTFWHLQVQALLLGAVALLPATAHLSTPAWTLTAIAAFAAFLHQRFADAKIRGPHPTRNARQAASLLRTIPIAPGSDVLAWRAGLNLTGGGAALLALVTVLDALGPSLAVALAAAIAVGLYFYEQAFVRAAQLPPLS